MSSLPRRRSIPSRRFLVLAGLLAACGGGTPGLPEPAYPPGIVYGPMVGRPTPTSVAIGWRTTSPSTGTVEFGIDASYGSTARESGLAMSHEVELDGLAPATTYHYRIAGDGKPLGTDHSFTTPPASPSARVRFVVLGDTGTDDATEGEAIALAGAQSPDFVLVAGDVAYDAGDATQVEEGFMEPFSPLMDRVPVFPVIGNHDAQTRNGDPLLEAVVLPTNSADGTERYYSFDWGACHVAALDSNSDLSVASAQREWLDADLAATSARWRFVVLHHPFYSSSRHGGRADLRESLGPVLEARHVDVVFSGHDHDYERTYPMSGGAPAVAGDPDYTDPPGPVFVVTGGGGKDLYESGTSDFTAYSESVHHVTLVTIEGDRLTLSAARLDGTGMDRMSIRKGL